MRELTYYVAVSLDGFIAGPEGQYDAFPAEGDHMAALLERYPDTVPTHAAEALGIDPVSGRFDTVLMGWNTYAVGLEAGVTSPYRHLEQIVFTRSHLQVDIGDPASPTLTGDDPVAVVRRLKAQTGPEQGGIWLCGGGGLAAAVIDEIDRLVLKRAPVALGQGIPLFAGGSYAPHRFDEVSTEAFGSGVVVSEYVQQCRRPR